VTVTWDQIEAAVAYVRQKTAFQPEVGIILGTGLGDLGARIEAEQTIPFGDIPHFVVSTALSHQGNLILGELGGRSVVAMQGRVHYYEGYTMKQITLPVRVMRALGARTLIMSLWSVEDESAREWMRALYEARLQEGLDTAEAVRHASLTVLNARRERDESTHPFYWAGFVAAGDWR